MICHQYKCIFIHIQRTAGSSLESWICGKDWWNIEPQTKHLLASQAKEKYAEYWDDYFKFSIVRNPWDRMVSFFRRMEREGLELSANDMQWSIDNYKNIYGFPLTIEFDNRFADYRDIHKGSFEKNSVYLNVLNESLDFIARFENIDEDMAYVQNRLGIPNKFDKHLEKSDKPVNYKDYYDEYSREEIANLFKRDIEYFNYDY
jgi:hypothetical protein